MAEVQARRPGRRREILDTFIRHVAEHGYDGTNFGDIAGELGLSKGTIVHHFGTKRRLLAELEEEYMRRRLAEAEAILAALSAPAEQLAGLLTAFVLYQTHDREHTVAFQREVARLRTDPALAGARELRDRYLNLVAGVVDRGTARGVFKPGDTRLRVLQLFGATQWMWTWYDPRGRVPPAGVAASFVDLALGGLLARRTGLDRLADPDGPVAGTVRDCLAGHRP
jgi:AcrR family transcriptional regulator